MLGNNEFTITLPDQFGLELNRLVSTKNLENIFAQISLADGFEKLIIDAEKLEWCEPIGCIILRSLVSSCIEQNKKVFWIKPRKEEAQNFLQQMGFLDKKEFIEGTGYCPILRVNEKNLDEVTGKIKALLQEKLNIKSEDAANDKLLRTLSFATSELLQNIFHHSEKSYGYISAMTFPSKKKLQIAIVDNGIGIRKSLLKNKRFSQTLVNDEAALAIAIQAKMTSNPKENPIHKWGNAGEGLFWAKEFLIANKGQFYIHSGLGQLLINSGETTLKTNGLWSGTIVVLQFDLNNPIAPQEVFNKYTSEENDAFINFS